MTTPINLHALAPPAGLASGLIPCGIFQMPSASLASLAAKNGRVHINCRNHVPRQVPDGFWTEIHSLNRHYGWTLSATDAMANWGPETTLADLERRAVCKVCGARQPHVVVECSTPGVKMGLG